MKRKEKKTEEWSWQILFTFFPDGLSLVAEHKRTDHPSETFLLNARESSLPPVSWAAALLLPAASLQQAWVQFHSEKPWTSWLAEPGSPSQSLSPDQSPPCLRSSAGNPDCLCSPAAPPSPLGKTVRCLTLYHLKGLWGTPTREEWEKSHLSLITSVRDLPEGELGSVHVQGYSMLLALAGKWVPT